MLAGKVEQMIPKVRKSKVFSGFYRVFAVLTCLLVVISMFSFSASAADTADSLAGQLLEAVERGQSSVQIRVESANVGSVLKTVFTRYPALHVYYEGWQGTIYNNSYTIANFQLCNTHVDWEDIYLASSVEDVYSIMACSLGRLESGFHFVMVNGPQITSDTITQLADQLKHDSYFSYMGYHGNAITWRNSNDAPVVAYEVTFKYWDGVPVSTLAQWRQEAEDKAVQVSRELFALDMPDYKKELLIHDWLVNNNTYGSDTDAPRSHMAYSAFITGDPVCQGYAEAALVLFQAAGIPAQYVPGTGTNSSGITESHGWNCVQLQGQWYFIDVTWDDPTSQNGTHQLRYDYFNVTTAQLGKDHSWDRSTTPNCTATRLSYDAVRALVDSDYGYYSDYSDRNLVTRERAQGQHSPRLRLCQRPDGQLPSVTPGYTQPPATYPGSYDPTEGYPSQPTVFDPTDPYPSGGFDPTYPGSYDPNPTYPTYPTNPKPESKGIGGILGGIAGGIAGIGAITAGIVRKKRKKEDEDKPVIFDPTNFNY